MKQNRYLIMTGLALAGFLVTACKSTSVSHTPSEESKMFGRVISLDQTKQLNYPWGWIKWLMNSEIDPSAEQTFGIVQINPGQSNALHMHPNCEEILHVISGSAENTIGNKTMIIKAGDTVRIPRGVAHKAKAIGNEPFVAVISYSSGKRQVANLGAGEG